MRGAKQRGMFTIEQHRSDSARLFSFPTRGGAGLIGTAVLMLAVTSAAPPALAASRAEIRLRGVVPAVCTIGVSNDSIDLSIVNGAPGTQIATVTEQCNAAAGYTVSVQSSNGGRMVGDQGVTSVAYTLSYDNAATGTAGTLLAERTPTGAQRQRALVVSLPPNPQANAGTYTDTVTLSISAK